MCVAFSVGGEDGGKRVKVVVTELTTLLLALQRHIGVMDARLRRAGMKLNFESFARIST
jgi:hypothetical protein